MVGSLATAAWRGPTPRSSAATSRGLARTLCRIQAGPCTHLTSMSKPSPVRVIAYIEALKGIVVILGASGLLSLVHRDAHAAAVALIEHLHLNPASKYPLIFLDAISKLQDTRLLLLAAGAGLYSLVRFVEAYGLFLERAWAEVLAAFSGAIYVPFEVIELMRRPTWHGAALLLLNLAVVGLMLNALRRRRSRGCGNAA